MMFFIIIFNEKSIRQLCNRVLTLWGNKSTLKIDESIIITMKTNNDDERNLRKITMLLP